MEDPEHWSLATKTIDQALLEWQVSDEAGDIGFSQAHYIKIKLEEAGFLTPEALVVGAYPFDTEPHEDKSKRG